MRLGTIVAGALCALAGTAGVASAHPAGNGCSALFNGLIEFCPKAEQDAGGNDARAFTDFGEVAADDLVRVGGLNKADGIFASASAYNSDLAFWGDHLVQGNYNGFSIVDISTPAEPKLVSQVACAGSQNDVSVWENLLITSTDSVRDRAGCEGNASGNSLLPSAWEGLRIFDWSDPAKPVYVGAVKTKCGSHTHTTIPDEANNRLLVYVSSYSPGAQVNCLPPHDLISVVEIPLDDPASARVIAEPVLFPITEGGGQSGTSGCHDITAYPAKGLAAGACMGEGIIMDIRNPAAPKKIATVTDPNFAFWHSATFSDDGTTVIFTDELGGGTSARCTDAYGPEKGADAVFDISDPAKPVFKSYFKIPRFQNTTENCVAHNGSLLPHPTRDLFVQSWYQGGTSVIDFTDTSNPVEIAYFDRGPVDESRLVVGGHWSSYWYNGYIYGSEIARGLDVFEFTGAKTGVQLGHLNAQTQEPLGF